MPVTATPLAEAELPRLDFLDADVAADPYAAMRERAGEHWLARTPTGYAVLSWDDCKSLARDQRLNTPRGLGLAAQGVDSGIVWDWATSIPLGMQHKAEHARMRRLATPALTPEKLERMRPYTRAKIESLVGAVAADGHADLTPLASEFSTSTICKLLEFPADRWKDLAAWSEAISNLPTINLGNEIERIEKVILEMREYTIDQVEQLRGREGEDLLTELMNDSAGGERLSYEEFLHLVEVLLMAGADTTKTMITLGVMLMSRHPDQWRLLAEDPEIVPAAVEEMMRYRPTQMGVAREAMEDFTYRDLAIPKGTVFLIAVPAANFDPEAYDEPERFDVRRFLEGGRAPKPSHLTFGFGEHVCAGSYLARMELQEAFKMMPQAWPGLRIDEIDERGVEWSSPFGVHGPTYLPIRWETNRNLANEL
jgi:cytochrome P450